MDWNAYWMGYVTGYDAAIREYEERTFADWMDGCHSDDREEYWEEDAYDE